MKEDNEFYNNPKKFEELKNKNNVYREYLSGEELEINNEDD